jgi:hypothetical protein
MKEHRDTPSVALFIGQCQEAPLGRILAHSARTSLSWAVAVCSPWLGLLNIGDPRVGKWPAPLRE